MDKTEKKLPGSQENLRCAQEAFSIQFYLIFQTFFMLRFIQQQPHFYKKCLQCILNAALLVLYKRLLALIHKLNQTV